MCQYIKNHQERKSHKIFHFFNHFPYRVTESKRKSWFYFSIISPCFHQLPCCIFTFSTYLRTHWGPCSHILTHLSLSLVITRVAISLLVHIPALLLFLSFLLGGVWCSLFQAPLAVPSVGRSKTGSYPSNNKRGNNTVGEHSISLLLHFIQVSAQGLSDVFEQMDVKMKDKL